MQTTVQARMTASARHKLVPEPQQAFWIPRLVRPAPEPAPRTSPPSDATTQHTAPTAAPVALFVVAPNLANDPADAGDASNLQAEHDEVMRAWEAATKLAAECDAKLALVHAVDHAIGRSPQPEAALAATPAAGSDEALAKPAGPPARREASPRHGRGRGRAAILTALTLAATAVVILTIPGSTDGPVSAIDREARPSVSPSAGASHLATETSRGVRPVLARPAERIPPREAAPALVACDPPAEPMVEAPAICAEASMLGAETPVPMDMTEETASSSPRGEDADRHGGALSVDAVPASEAAPEASTSPPRQRSRPSRGRRQGIGDADDALVGPRVTPTSRDLLDVPMDVPASDG